jgi:phosphate transport system substrate-binding protein
MKSNLAFSLLAALILTTSGANAQTKHLISGSDTMGGLMTDAIIAAGFDKEIGYVGGGSGVGEKAFANGEINITAMSRAMKPEVIDQIKASGSVVEEYIVALDGVAVFVNELNRLPGLDLNTLARIFTCEITSWGQVPGSGRTSAIHAFRRDDLSGTTDTFKTLVGLKAFGACVTVVGETADIAEKTGRDADAIGYAGLSGKNEHNFEVALSKSGAAYVTPTAATIRNETYPLSRNLYIYAASGKRGPTSIEARLLDQLLDRSFLDPIVQDHDFITID